MAEAISFYFDEHAGITFCYLTKYPPGALLQALLIVHGAMTPPRRRNYLSAGIILDLCRIRYMCGFQFIEFSPDVDFTVALSVRGARPAAQAARCSYDNGRGDNISSSLSRSRART